MTASIPTSWQAQGVGQFSPLKSQPPLYNKVRIFSGITFQILVPSLVHTGLLQVN